MVHMTVQQWSRGKMLVTLVKGLSSDKQQTRANGEGKLILPRHELQGGRDMVIANMYSIQPQVKDLFRECRRSFNGKTEQSNSRPK